MHYIPVYSIFSRLTHLANHHIPMSQEKHALKYSWISHMGHKTADSFCHSS